MLLIFFVVSFFLNVGNEALPITARDNLTSSPSAIEAYTAKRSMYAIVWNCLTTTFLCAWASMHLDTTHGMRGTWKRRGYRILFLSLSVIMPEYIVGWALKQRKTAKKILQTLHEDMGSDGIPRRKTYEDRGWTMTHAHLLDTGGFVLCVEEKNDKEFKVDDALVEQRVDILSSERFYMLLKESSIKFPTITTCEILDRSKSDSLAKFIAALQTLWFVIQCTVRHKQKLALTELELTTLALASLNWLTLLFWRHKPQDITIPIPVYLVEGSPEWYRRNSDQRLGESSGKEEKGEQVRAVKSEVQMSVPERSLWFQRERQWFTATVQELMKREPSLPFLSSLWMSITQLWSLLLGSLVRVVGGLSMITGMILGVAMGTILLALAGLVALPVGLMSWIISIDNSNEEPWISIYWLGSFPRICVYPPGSSPRIRVYLPRSFPQSQVIEEEEGEGIQTVRHPLSETAHNSELLKHSIYDIHGELRTLYFHGLMNARRSTGLPDIRGLWPSIDRHPWRGRAFSSLRIILALVVLLLSGIPFLAAALLILTTLVISTPLSTFFLRMPRICGFIDEHIITHRISEGQDRLIFYSNILLKNPIDYFDHLSHFLIALTIGTSFGGVHCWGWNYDYPTTIEQIMWRASSLVLTVIPSIFFSMSFPLIITHGPIPLIVIMSYLNLVSLLLLAYLMARFAIIGLAFELLRDQPEMTSVQCPQSPSRYSMSILTSGVTQKIWYDGSKKSVQLKKQTVQVLLIVASSKQGYGEYSCSFLARMPTTMMTTQLRVENGLDAEGRR